MRRAWEWLIGGAFVVVLVVMAVKYHWIGDTNKPITERIDQPAGESPFTSPDKSTDGARPDSAAGREEPSVDTPARQIAGPAAASALTPEQREKIRGQIAGPRESRVDTSEFTPTIGTTVPAHVLLHRLPTELADIMGGYHGSDYLIVLDKLVIVDPNVRRIVAVVPGV
jgi:Protein of unknown function (DUF1236)